MNETRHQTPVGDDPIDSDLSAGADPTVDTAADPEFAEYDPDVAALSQSLSGDVADEPAADVDAYPDDVDRVDGPAYDPPWYHDTPTAAPAPAAAGSLELLDLWPAGNDDVTSAMNAIEAYPDEHPRDREPQVEYLAGTVAVTAAATGSARVGEPGEGDVDTPADEGRPAAEGHGRLAGLRAPAIPPVVTERVDQVRRKVPLLAPPKGSHAAERPVSSSQKVLVGGGVAVLGIVVVGAILLAGNGTVLDVPEAGTAIVGAASTTPKPSTAPSPSASASAAAAPGPVASTSALPTPTPSPTPTPTPTPTPSPSPTPLSADRFSVNVLNGTRIKGLAGQTATAVRNDGWRIRRVGDYRSGSPGQTTVFYDPDVPGARSAAAKLAGSIPGGAVTAPSSSTLNRQLTVVVVK